MNHSATEGAVPTHYATFREFYRFYLSEHANRACRLLHFIGSSLVIGVVVAAILQRDLRWLLLAPLAGYGFAWIGHFVFERNRPASFKQPLYSFIGDWAMYWDILRGRIKL
ncbi:MAG: DUF962 domain-containing protein [Xanthomonadales bacterium]|nr:DUF962 domain-containing protein [Xanthomonadales bacterium]